MVKYSLNDQSILSYNPVQIKWWFL